MAKGLSDNQKWALSIAYAHALRNDGAATPITTLSEVFFDDDKYYDAFSDYGEAAFNKSVLFQTRRMIQALIRRGLMEEAGTAISEIRGYTRVCKAYALTDTGRPIGQAEHEAISASIAAMRAARRLEDGI
jgi:hypothetical protein